MSRSFASSPAQPSRARATGKTIMGGGTTLGSPLQTRTVTTMESNMNMNSAAVEAMAVAASTPSRSKPKPSSSSSSNLAFGSSVRSTHARTPSKTPNRTTRPSPASATTSSTAASPSPSASGSSSSSSYGAGASSSTSHIPAAGASVNVKPHVHSPRLISRQRYDNTKHVNPFSTKTKFKTSFSEAYVNGRVPCRINHGSVHHKLQWDCPSSELNFGFLLPIVCDGLCETEHPYVIIARQAFTEMVAEGGVEKVAPLVAQLIQPLRRALMHENQGVFIAACDAIIALSKTVGPQLNEYLDLLVVQINKKSLHAKLSLKVQETINALAENGGDPAIPIIKKRVPAFA